MIHELKTWREPFAAMWSGKKKFEFRKNDRNFQVGDLLMLQEYDQEVGTYTGRYIVTQISYILSDGFGLPPGYAILQLAHIARRKSISRRCRVADMFYILRHPAPHL